MTPPSSVIAARIHEVIVECIIKTGKPPKRLVLGYATWNALMQGLIDDRPECRSLSIVNIVVKNSQRLQRMFMDYKVTVAKSRNLIRVVPDVKRPGRPRYMGREFQREYMAQFIEPTKPLFIDYSNYLDKHGLLSPEQAAKTKGIYDKARLSINDIKLDLKPLNRNGRVYTKEVWDKALESLKYPTVLPIKYDDAGHSDPSRLEFPTCA